MEKKQGMKSENFEYKVYSKRRKDMRDIKAIIGAAVGDNHSEAQGTTILTAARVVAAAVIIFCMTALSMPRAATASSLEVLDPNANGSYTASWTYTGGTNYAVLAQAGEPDGDTTKVTTTTKDVPYTVNLTTPSVSAGVINSVTVYATCKDAAGPEQITFVVNNNGGTNYLATAQALTAAYAEYSGTWTTNPWTAAAWTWSDLTNLQAGFQGTATGGWGGNISCTELYVNVDYWPKEQNLVGFVDEGSDQYTPTNNVRMVKIETTSGGGIAGNGFNLTGATVNVGGTLSSSVTTKIWWNTIDSFPATPTASQTCTIGTDCVFSGLSGIGNASGYVWFTIDLPSQVTGTYKLTVKSFTASGTPLNDYIPLGTGKSTKTYGVKPPTQNLDDFRDNAKNFNLNRAAGFTDLVLAKIETKKTSEGKPLTSSKVKIEGTLSNISNISVWWNTTDNFAAATRVGQKTSGIALNTEYTINHDLGSPGLSNGFLWYSISTLPSARGKFRLTIPLNAIAGVTRDNIPLPKSTSYTFITNPYAIQVCGDCHAYPVKDGTRSGDTGAVQGTHSTHARFNPMKCNTCHKDTTSGETNSAHRDGRIQLRSKLGASGSYNLYTAWPQTNTPTMRVCSNLACHNNFSQTWGSGASMTCNQCHYSNVDTDDFTFDYFTSAAVPRVYSGEWKNRGHGKSSGTYDRTGNNAAKLACTNCHDNDIGHGDPVKPYKTKGTGDQDIFCLNCHGTAADRGSLFTPFTAAKRDIKTHSQGVFSTVGYANITTWRIYQIKCIDCHDPHGDSNISMIHKKPWTGGSDQKGRPAAYYNGYSTVKFTKYTGTNGLGKTDGTKFYLCEVCHTRTKFHKQGGTGTSHFDGIKCPDCHTHDMGWAPYKGCTDCHAVARNYLYSVRQITGPGGDFVRLSRHVSDGSSNEIVTNYDCIVCHREGDYAKANAGLGFTSDTLHWDGTTSTTRMVHLRNVDSRDTGWTWNKWVKTETMRTDLDNFCMACHDTNGANDIAVNAADNGLSVPPGTDELRWKPFNSNDTLRNGRDGLTTRSRIVDVKGQFDPGTGGTGTGYNGNPSQHAVRGARYSTNNASWTSAAWVSHTLRNSTVMNTVREKATLHCSDCHLSETNAHGAANAWHMLLNGTANDYTTDYAMTGVYPATTASIVCYKCHASATYGSTAAAGSRFTHNQEGRVWSTGDYGGQADNGAKLGPACMICHAGGGYGDIHGMSGTYNANGYTFYSYRFQPGGYFGYAPGTSDNDWNTTAAGTCYLTKSSWVTCAQHSGAKPAANNNYARPVKY